MRSMMPSPVARCGIDRDRGDAGVRRSRDRGSRIAGPGAHTLSRLLHTCSLLHSIRAGGPLNDLYFTFCTYGVITAL